MDRFFKFCLPPRTAKLESDLNRGSVLELSNGTPLGVIAVDVYSSEVHEAETWQRNGRDDGGIRLRAFSPVNRISFFLFFFFGVARNFHAVVLGVLGDSGDWASEPSGVSRVL